MKKLVVVLLILCSLIEISGCERNHESNRGGNETESVVLSDPETSAAHESGTCSQTNRTAKTTGAANRPITAEQKKAEDIIKKKIGTDTGKRIIEYDHTEKFRDREYYVIHAYYLGKDMAFTYGWYAVDATSEKAYQENLSADNDDDVFVPLE